MGRSQRHMIMEQGTNSQGASLDQGVVAPGLLLQVDDPPVTYSTIPLPQGVEDVEVPIGPSGGPLQGSFMTGALPTDIVNPDPGPIPEPPDPDLKPVLNSINPSSARIGDPDVTMNVNGAKFVEGSVIMFNNGDENTTFVDDGQLSTIVKPSTATTPGSYPVQVRNPDGQVSDMVKSFTFEEANPLATRTFPIGPFDISSVTGDGELLSITVPAGSDVRSGDSVTIEATGNTSVNGTYTVGSVQNDVVLVPSTVALASPIENHGRLIVTDGPA